MNAADRSYRHRKTGRIVIAFEGTQLVYYRTTRNGRPFGRGHSMKPARFYALYEACP